MPIPRTKGATPIASAIDTPAKEAPAPFKRFTVLPTIDGFEVIDTDGRPVASRATRRQAAGTAFRLNRAAANGGLSHAFGIR
jgi:hypothetical protein